MVPCCVSITQLPRDSERVGNDLRVARTRPAPARPRRRMFAEQGGVVGMKPQFDLRSSGGQLQGVADHFRGDFGIELEMPLDQPFGNGRSQSDGRRLPFA